MLAHAEPARIVSFINQCQGKPGALRLSAESAGLHARGTLMRSFLHASSSRRSLSHRTDLYAASLPA
jgi:hypothetical protein